MNIWDIRKLFYHDQAAIMACMERGFPQISLLSVRISLRFFTEERSYQWLKDATSFGLLSEKSAK